ncbi:dUTPase [Paraglaciecola Antarctic GD virus 1]|nr:dUTPase [Paraglaciecola Antarctic GD virus 1]
MAEQNACASLAKSQDYRDAETKYNGLLLQGIDPYQSMLNMQSNLQAHLSEKLSWNPIPEDLKTCGEILDWLQHNNDAIDDERRELYTALGGMSNGEKKASAVWKTWKADHIAKRDMLMTDLSEDDQNEIAFEMIDQLHFIKAQLLALKLDAKKIFCLYYVKNAENFRRYDTNY